MEDNKVRKTNFLFDEKNDVQCKEIRKRIFFYHPVIILFISHVT